MQYTTPQASLHTRDLAGGTREYAVDCPFACTLSAAPAATVVELGDDAIARVVLMRHSLECNACDRAALWARLGTEPESGEECRLAEQERQRAYARGLRN